MQHNDVLHIPAGMVLDINPLELPASVRIREPRMTGSESLPEDSYHYATEWGSDQLTENAEVIKGILLKHGVAPNMDLLEDLCEYVCGYSNEIAGAVLESSSYR